MDENEHTINKSDNKIRNTQLENGVRTRNNVMNKAHNVYKQLCALIKVPSL